jgi:hypothetical protein
VGKVGRRRGSGSVRTDELGGVQCAGSRGAAKDRPAQSRRPAFLWSHPLWPPCGLVGLLN